MQDGATVRRTLHALACAATAAVWPSPANAEPPPRELRYDTAADVAVIATGGALWFASELLKGELAPKSCRWCDRNDDGSDALNGLDSAVRNGLRWSNPDAADTASYVTAFALAPASAFGLDALAASSAGDGRAFWVDALVITEASILAGNLNQLVKFIVGRERPFVHVLPPDQKGLTSHPSDNNVSFYSGHTTLSFALATSAGTVASMRGYRLAPLVWAAGMTMGVTSGYLRIAGDRHYFTDVLTAALVGSAIGFAVPILFHGPRATESPSTQGVTAAPVAGAQTLTISGTW